MCEGNGVEDVHRLPSRFRFVGMCNGNLRARAEYATGHFLGMDPSCYLTDEEIREPVTTG